jgi:hypothetical protein
MTSAGQPDPQVEVDLTASPLEGKPGPMGHGQGIEARFGLSIFGKLFRFAVRVHDKSAEITDSVRFLIVTAAVMIPALVALLVCRIAHASTNVTVVSSLGAGAVFTVIAFVWLRLCRQPSASTPIEAQRTTDQAQLQRNTGNKHKGNKRNKSARKRSNNKPRNRRR